MSIRVVLVDDHAMVREGLRGLLSSDAELEVVGEAADGNEALAKVAELAPDVVVMDLAMAGLNGLEATRQLAGAPKAPRVVLLSAYVDRHYVLAAFAAGAVGYLGKLAEPAELLQAVRAAARGERYLGAKAAALVSEQELAAPTGPDDLLSPRERQVLHLIAEGLSTAQIAASLYVSIKTAESHRRNIMHKLGLFSVAELTRYALRHGIISE